MVSPNMLDFFLTWVGAFAAWLAICYVVKLLFDKSEYVGVVGDSVEGVFSVVSVKRTKHMNFFNVLKDEQQNVFKCFSDVPRFSEGKVYFLTARIKGHDDFHGVRGTHLHLVRVIGEIRDGEAHPETEEEFEDACIYWNKKAMALEEEGKTYEAMLLFEKCVRHGYSGFGPYDRLAAMYRNHDLFRDEERVLKRAIECVHDNEEIEKVKFAGYVARLEELEQMDALKEVQEEMDELGLEDLNEDEAGEVRQRRKIRRATQAGKGPKDGPAIGDDEDGEAGDTPSGANGSEKGGAGTGRAAKKSPASAGGASRGKQGAASAETPEGKTIPLRSGEEASDGSAADGADEGPPPAPKDEGPRHHFRIRK